MSIRGAINFARRFNRDADIEARADDLTAAALAQDVARERERVESLRNRLRAAEKALAQRQWELEVYALHGTPPKRAGLAKRVAAMAQLAVRSALRPDAREGLWS